MFSTSHDKVEEKLSDIQRVVLPEVKNKLVDKFTDAIEAAFSILETELSFKLSSEEGCEDLHEEIKTLLARVLEDTKIEVDNGEIESFLDEIDQSLEVATRYLEDAESELENAKEDISSLEQELEDLKSEKEEVEEELEQTKSELAEFVDMLSECQGRL